MHLYVCDVIPCYSTPKSSIMPQELMVRDVRKAVLIVQLQPCNFSFTWNKLVLYSASYHFGCFLEKNIVVWLLSCAFLKCCCFVSTGIILVNANVLLLVLYILLEGGVHGPYSWTHASITTGPRWAVLPGKFFFSCNLSFLTWQGLCIIIN